MVCQHLGTNGRSNWILWVQPMHCKSAEGDSHFAQSCEELLERPSVSIHAVVVQRDPSSLSTASAASRGHAV